MTFRTTLEVPIVKNYSYRWSDVGRYTGLPVLIRSNRIVSYRSSSKTVGTDVERFKLVGPESDIRGMIFLKRCRYGSLVCRNCTWVGGGASVAEAGAETRCGCGGLVERMRLRGNKLKPKWRAKGAGARSHNRCN